MAEYVATERCLIEVLRRRLDDEEAARCGRCAKCLGSTFPTKIDPELVEVQGCLDRGPEAAPEQLSLTDDPAE